MEECWVLLPGEGLAKLAVIPLEIEALVVSVEEAAIKYLVEPFEVFEVLPDYLTGLSST